MNNTAELEEFLLCENKLEFIKKQIPGIKIKYFNQQLLLGTDNYYFYKFLHLFQTCNGSLSDSDRKEIIEYHQKFNTENRNYIYKRYLLFELEREKDEQKRKKLFEELNKKYLHYSFDYSQPPQMQGISGIKVNPYLTEETSNKLNSNFLDFNGVVEKSYTDLSIMKKIKQLGNSYVNAQKLMSIGKKECIEYYIKNYCLSECNEAPFLISKYLQQLRSDKKSITNAVKFHSLTLLQMQELAKLEPELLKDNSFIKCWMEKEFPSNLQELALEDWMACKKIIESIVLWVEKLDQKFQYINDILAYQLLALGLENRSFNFELFVKYLEKPMQSFSLYNKEYEKIVKTHLSQQENFWLNSFLCFSKIQPSELIEKFLIQYFKEKDKIEPFDKYLQTHYLEKLLNKTRLYQGKAVSSLSDYLSQHEIEEIQNEKLLTICKHNKDSFKTNEEVSIDVEVKNISEIEVKVYEIETENYLLQFQQEIDGQLALEGLIAVEQTKFTFTQPCAVKHTEQFKFESIQKQYQGVFIIEFVGGGLLSRAVIKKGALMLVDKVALTGQKFTILDQDLCVCKGGTDKRVGMWIDRQFHPANENGEISIPFAPSKSTYNVILVNRQFASLKNGVEIKAEKYEFLCNYIYNEETFILGAKAQIVVQPKLFINNIPASLKLIEKPQILVTLINESDVPITTTFEDITFDEQNDNELEIQVQTKIKRVIIDVTGKVKTLNSQNEFANLHHSHCKNISNEDLTSNMCIQLLKKNQKKEYEIYLLGKTGEKKANISLEVSFAHKLYVCNEKAKLITDSNGIINLGLLENVESITSKILGGRGNISGEQKKWQIAEESQTCIPKTIKICENELLKFPFFGGELNKHTVSLHQYTNESNINIKYNLLQQLTIDGNFLQLPPLKTGNYLLKLFNLSYPIEIKVLKGKYWNDSQLLISENKLIDMSSIMSILMINSVEINSNQEGKYQIKMQIYSNFPKTTKIHILAQQFQPQDINFQCSQAKQLLKSEQSKSYEIPDFLNEFYSNKQLSSEQNYVNSRKNQERYIGNNLERPQILLKRIEIRETSFEKEKLDNETEFKNKDKKSRAKKRDQETNFNGGGGRAGQQSICSQQALNSVYNFLQKSSIIISNQKLNEQGQIEIKDLDLKSYSNLLILVSNYGQVISKNIQLSESCELQVRDLREKLSSEDKLIVPQFESVSLTAGKEWSTEDLNSTEFQIVDSMAKLYNYQLELRKLKGSDNESKEGYAIWKFLTKWHSFSLEEKHQYYEKYSSHEMNLFTKFKDPAYFEIFVKPFLKNKFEKTFVDYFLLEEKEQLLIFNNAKKMRKLNYMERVLLIIFLKDNTMIEDAKEIYKSIANENKMKPTNQQLIKKLYETILSIKEKENVSSRKKQEEQKYKAMMEVEKMMKKNMECCMSKSLSKHHQITEMCALPRKCEIKEQLFCMNEEEFLGHEEEEIKNRRAYASGKSGKQFVAEFKQVEKTKEYGERQYFGQKSFRKNDFYNKVGNNPFWEELALFVLENNDLKNFLSTHFIFCNSNHTEMIGCLTFLGLPFKESAHSFEQFKQKGLRIKAADNALIFSREMKECKVELKNNLLVAQRFFDPDNRFEESEDEPGVKQEREATEFVIDKTYGCQVVMTNLSDAQRDIQMIAHLPQGALPIRSSEYTHNQLFCLSPYSSETYEYLLYFPKEGKFSLLPATISKNNSVLAVAQKKDFTVYSETQVKTLETMDQILAQGSMADILAFAKNKNIQNPNVFNFQSIYYLLKNRDFYSEFLGILKRRKLFNKIVWQFSVLHGDYATFKDFQMNKTAKFLEYHPIVNQRIHILHQNKSNILNIEFKSQYAAFLKHLATQYEPISDTQKLCFVYYLLLQERINEAIKLFQSINAQPTMPQKLQYDYFAAYLDFYIGYPNFHVARDLCEQYLDYPELYWRNLFYSIANQIAEYDGDVPLKQQQELKSAAQKNESGASKEEILEATLQRQSIEIMHQNINKIAISFYILDLETLFSRDPFFLESKQDYSFIKPIERLEQSLQLSSKEAQKASIEIPKKLQSQNVFIQLRASNKMRSLTYFSSLLQVHIFENFGQLKVMDQQLNPLPKVYVKSYAEHFNGNSMFYKDGYTDLRGKFDYASASSQNIKDIKKFSFFIMSDHFGTKHYYLSNLFPRLLNKRSPTAKLNWQI